MQFCLNVHKNELLLAGEHLRIASLIRMFPVEKIPKAAWSSETQAKVSDGQILASPFFESPFFEKMISTNSLTAQITFGGEYLGLQHEVRRYLEAGHHLQVWFDRPADYLKIRDTFRRNWSQITPVYLLTKKYSIDQIFELNQDESITFLALPKQNSLDSLLSIEELHYWVQRARQQFEVHAIYIEKFFDDRSGLVRRYYEFFSDETYQEILQKKEPIFFILYKSFDFLRSHHLTFLVELIKNLLFFVSHPSLRSARAIAENILGALRSVGTWTYWNVRKSVVHIRGKSDIFNRLYWSVYPNFCDIRGSMKKFSVYVYWRVIEGKNWIRRQLQDSFWAHVNQKLNATFVYRIKYGTYSRAHILDLKRYVLEQLYHKMKTLFLWLSYPIRRPYWTLKFWWKNGYFRPTRISQASGYLFFQSYHKIKSFLLYVSYPIRKVCWILHFRWENGYYSRERLTAQAEYRCLQFYHKSKVIVFWLCFPLRKIYWRFKFKWDRGYYSADRLTERCVYFSVQSYHKIKTFLLTMMFPFRKMHWVLKFHWQNGRFSPSQLIAWIAYLGLQIYHKLKTVVLVVFYPIRKIYWFSSFQFKKRILRLEIRP